MKTTVLFILIFTPLLSLAQGKIFFLEKTLHYGTIPQNQPYKRNTIIANVGNEPLQLYVLKTSCGCLVGLYPKKPIPAGELAEIQFMFNTRGRYGHFMKSATLRCSDTTEQMYIWRMRGKIATEEEPIEVQAADPASNCDRLVELDTISFLPLIKAVEGETHIFLKMATNILVDSSKLNHLIYDISLRQDTIALDLKYVAAGKCREMTKTQNYVEYLPLPAVEGKSFPIAIQYAGRKLLLSYEIVNSKCTELRITENGKTRLYKACLE